MISNILFKMKPMTITLKESGIRKKVIGRDTISSIVMDPGSFSSNHFSDKLLIHTPRKKVMRITVTVSGHDMFAHAHTSRNPGIDPMVPGA